MKVKDILSGDYSQELKDGFSQLDPDHYVLMDQNNNLYVAPNDEHNRRILEPREEDFPEPPWFCPAHRFQPRDSDVTEVDFTER